MESSRSRTSICFAWATCSSAATVQQAQQTLMTATLFPVVLLERIPLLLLNVVPDGREYLRDLVAAADPQQVMLIVMAVLVVLDLALLVAVMARFKRARLVAP